MYEGQDRIGSLVERHGQPHAYDADRYHVAFLNCRKAMRAMPMTAPRHCCGQDLSELIEGSTPFKAQIFDPMQHGGEDGIDRLDHAVSKNPPMRRGPLRSRYVTQPKPGGPS